MIKTVSSEKAYTVDKFKGLNRAGSRFNMDKVWVWDLLNGYIEKTADGRGKIRQRHGVTKFNTTVLHDSSTKIRYLFEAKWAGGTHTVARAYDGWYKYNTGTKAFDSLDTSRGVDTKASASMFMGYLVMTDGGVPRKCDSSFNVTNLSSDSNMPQDATACHAHQHRLWLNSSANPMEVYGSKVDDATSSAAFSTSSDSVTLDLSKVLPVGDEVIGFRTMADVLLVILCKKHIVIYNAPTTYSDISLVQIIRVGALTNYAVEQLGNDWVYPAKEGVNSLASSVTYQKLDIDDLSKNIAPLYRDYVSQTSDTTQINGVFYHKLNHYYLCFPIANAHQVLVYSLDFKNFVGRFQFNGFVPYSFLEASDGTLYIGADNGYVYKYDESVNTDDGNVVDFEWHLPYLGNDSPFMYKAPRELETFIETDKDVTVYFDWWFGVEDYGAGVNTHTISITGKSSLWREVLWRDGFWRAQGRSLYKTYDLIGRGKLIGVRVRHSTSGARITIPYLILKTILEGEK